MIRRLLPILLLLFCCPTIYAQNKQVLHASEKHGSNGLSIKGSSQNQIKMSANIGVISLNDTTTKKGDFIELQADGTYISGAEGEPQLPALRKLVEMPMGSKPTIIIKHADTTFYALSDFGIDRKLSPHQPSQSKSGKEQKIKYKKRSYRRNYFTQSELVSTSLVGSMRGVGIYQIAVNPVRYNPKQNTLMVFSNIEFDVDFDSGTAKSNTNETSPYFEGVYSSLGNHKSLTTPSNHPVKYLIITDTAFVGALADFITWKRQKGFNVVVATTDTIGNFANDIKEWVSTQYHSATDDNPAPSFLLLAGDTDKIPTSRTGASSGYGTDLYYACMDGDDDIVPDIYYGRFSARTAAQMKAIADKTIAYEKYQFEDPSYLAKATLIAGYDGTYRSAIGIPTVNYITNNRINAKNGYSTINKYTQSYTNCYSDPSISVGLVNYTAHGSTTTWEDPELTQNKVRSFNNQGQFPFVIANCCLSGQFTKDECIGETWLRKENSGAVAYIGSLPKTYWHEDFYWAVGAHNYSSGVSPDTSATTTGAFDVPFVSDYVCGGGIMYTGNLSVAEAYNNDYHTNVSPRYYWEGYNYLGDPSLLVYFGEAKDNVVSHSITIPVSSNTVTVNALGGSYVAISQNNELLGVAYVPTPENSVNVTIKPVSEPGEIDVVVTKPRYKPYFGKITAILPDKSYLVINENPFKNNDLQYGGTANFDVVVSNLGQQTSQTATVSITSTSPLVKNVSATQTTLSPIGSQTNQTFANLCHIELKENIADGTKIPFIFSVTEAERTTANVFTLNVTAPKLKLDASATIDKPNGHLFPGETADIIIPITNIGHERMDFATIKLTADGNQPTVMVISSEQTVRNLNPGDTAICRFTIAADEYANMMTLFNFKVSATAGEPLHSDTCRYTITIGKLEENVIGTSTSHTEWYPLNNYYKCSITQVLYTTADLGKAPMQIDEMALQLAKITPQNKFDGYKDFKIKMKFVKSNSLKDIKKFIDMSDAETVFDKDLLVIKEAGELKLKFDKPFVYDGKSNVLVEFLWGKNSGTVAKNDRPDVYCHSTSVRTVAYDAEDDPEEFYVYNTTSYRPNTTFLYQKPKYLLFDVKDTDSQPVADIEIMVDGRKSITNINGFTQLYTFSNRRIEYELNTIDYAVDKEVIETSNDTVRFSLQLRRTNVFAVTFHVIDSTTHSSLENAQITINNHTVTTDNYGWGTFDKVPNCPTKYKIEANDYYTANGTININTDTLILIGISKLPLITFNINDNGTPAAGIVINIGESQLTTNNQGLASLRTAQTDIIPYSISIGNQTALADTIWNLRKSATININLALIDTIGTGPQPNDTVGNGQQPNDTLPPKMYSLTFYLSDGVNPIDSALITVNGIDKNTDSTGHAVFDGIADSTNIAYTISKDGYEVANGRRTLSDSMICTGNITIRLSLRKVAGTSYGTEEQAGIKIYPNPSDGLINLPDFNGQTVSIIDANGRLVKKAIVDGGRIDLRPITAGIYTLTAETQNGIVSVIIVIK